MRVIRFFNAVDIGGQTVCHTLTTCYMKAGFACLLKHSGEYGQIAVVELNEIEDEHRIRNQEELDRDTKK